MTSTNTDINWGYNCLTVGVHHGRPETLWNLPLIQAVSMFTEVEFKEIVVARIYNDAMMFVEHGDEPRPSKEWADKVRELAEEQFSKVLKSKTREISEYYESHSWKYDVQDVIQRIKENRLNPRYEPKHSHDSINLLCRIIGVDCSLKADSVISQRKHAVQ